MGVGGGWEDQPVGNGIGWMSADDVIAPFESLIFLFWILEDS